MNSMKTLALSGMVTALSGLSVSAWAHPSWMGSNVIGGTASPYTSQFNAITVGHGCSTGDGGYLGVKAVSWIQASGANPSAPAPYSTNCDDAGRNCTGSGTQPSVARFLNSQGTTSSTTGITTFAGKVMGEPTTLGAELVDVSTLAGRFRLNQNKGVFATQKLHLDGAGNPIGFWEKSGFVDPKAIAVTDMRMTSGGLVFTPGSCATQLVVRLAGADICKINKKITNEHHQNLWFGGPTSRFPTGHGVHENFWLSYYITRPAKDIPSTCTEATRYSVVVTPTIEEIDSSLKFTGWAVR